MVPKFPFDAAVRSASQLQLAGSRLEEVNHHTRMQRLGGIHPSKAFLWALGIGAAATVFLSVMRLRFTWWPLHPIFMLCFGCWTVTMFSASFLIGWALKLAIVRLGGMRWFIPARTFMIGVIAGDLLGGLTFMVAGWFYYAATGQIPPAYRMMGI